MTDTNTPDLATIVGDKVAAHYAAQYAQAPTNAQLENATRPATVGQAIAQVMRTVGAVGRNSQNKQDNFWYRSIDDLLNALSPAMADAGLVIVPGKMQVEQGQVTYGRRDTKSQFARVTIDYMIVGPDGTMLPGQSVGESFDSGDKATSKAITMAEKSFIIALFKIPVENVRDPDGQSYGGDHDGGDADDGNGYQGAAEQAQPGPPGIDWRDVFNRAHAHGIEGLVKFLTWAADNGAPEQVLTYAEEVLDAERQQEAKVAEANKAGQDGPRNEGDPDTRAEATKSVAPEPGADDGAIRQAAARFTTRLNGVLEPGEGREVNIARLDSMVEQAADEAENTQHPTWIAVYERALKAREALGNSSG